MRGVKFAEGEFYHLYNRGVDKRVVFTTTAEYKRFLCYLSLLNDVNSSRITHLLRTFHDEAKPRNMQIDEPRHELVAIGAYCLMPNHFHLYVTPFVEGGVSKFMQRLQTAYTMYFNQKHERSGALFQGTFKAMHVGNDRYAKYLFSYIHLNPAKLIDPTWKEFGARDFSKMREYIRSYPYSSFAEYAGTRHIITNPSPFPDYFRRERDFDAHIDDWALLSGEFCKV